MPRQDGFGLAGTRRTLPMALLRAREAVMERFRPLLASHDVTEQQWRILRVLEESEGPLDATQLAGRASILAPSLTRILKTLEARAFLEVSRDPDDGRRSLIRMTEEGRVFIRKVSRVSVTIYADIEAAIGRDRIDHLLDEIEHLLAALDREDGSHV